MVMEITIAMAISIIGCVLSISNFVLGRKDKSNHDTEQSSYNQGRLDQTLKNIIEKLDKIEKKLDTYDSEVQKAIDKSMQLHIDMYHNK